LTTGLEEVRHIERFSNVIEVWTSQRVARDSGKKGFVPDAAPAEAVRCGRTVDNFVRQLVPRT
jgi:hypothetical protein